MMARDATFATCSQMETPELKTFRITDVPKAPEVPGIYAWYLSIHKNDNASEYHEVFKSRKLVVQASGGLTEKYEGHIELQALGLEVADSDLLRRAVIAFSPPLYIGITEKQTLRVRLGQHRSAIVNVIHGSDPGSEDTGINEFANRIGEVIRNREGVSTHSLFVRALPLPESTSISELKPVEYFLNRTYVPPYGER